ncbi:MAG: hypothetical protein COZ06_22640 [Armatimonadetes bacterium CG_4_10_14_3_um_filter_66_18]|nr:hypothetical protein [Armatimonadota bacterium]OIP01195.1 MAG: hypothetical protein AUJ96_17615 [Armatimonadetes bacterium CG2_30_66_41]PIX41418.1 MAG: hypothetical protein COZ57_23435 [Armatimonadetes bacterium CG_4_8_14_3_um_filter_66_20]PIY43551.1 MAG: hypothetical protein COZ06_22640 [Armatimonadetes bacterium CG_4_10_14_3_um_filter_66_18]PIZ39062.1 MAG: hypothetical protein COY42_22725 [Armatimonadetes bacterium CG_4_10_14_0_8_um_filter_66_14]
MTVTQSMLILLLAATFAGCEAPAGLALKAEEVTYDSGRAELAVAVHCPGARAGLICQVQVAGVTAQTVTAKLMPPLTVVLVPYPLAPLMSEVRVTLDPEQALPDPDRSDNAVALTMWTALANMARELADMPNLNTSAKLEGRQVVEVEVESLPDRHNVKVEDAPGASGGKAVRLLDASSYAEGEVELEAGTYLFAVRAMGFAGDQDALNASLGGQQQRGHLSGLKTWVLQDNYGVARLRAGKHKLRVYFDEPQVLADKVILVKWK